MNHSRCFNGSDDYSSSYQACDSYDVTYSTLLPRGSCANNRACNCLLRFVRRVACDLFIPQEVYETAQVTVVFDADDAVHRSRPTKKTIDDCDLAQS